MADLRVSEGVFPSRDGLKLFGRDVLPPGDAAIRAHVAVVHGYSDHLGRYEAVFEKLAGSGLAVHAFDYRGHGRAEGRRGHCDSFRQFHDDLDAFLARVRPQSSGRPLFLLSHSHGGLMVLSWAIARGADGIAGAVFSAPFLRLAFQPPRLKLWAARILERVLPAFPLGNELQVTQLTRDPEWQRRTEADPLYGHVTTPRWFAQALATQDEVLRRAAEFRLPALFLHGTADPIADPDATRQLVDALGSTDKKLSCYDGFLHEILNEVGKERVRAEILDWILARA